MKPLEQIKTYFAVIGRQGGLVKSKQKAIASRLNGAKGGRPRRKILGASPK